jgi:hypothetical protein
MAWGLATTTTTRWATAGAGVLLTAAVLLASASPAGAATRSGTPIAAHPGAAGHAGHPGASTTVSNHVISGTETSISCMTAARCIAVGSGAHGGQAVSLYNGNQTRVTTVLRAPLTSVSCPNKTGCWALGPLFGTGPNRHTADGVQLVKVGPTGKVIKVIKISVPSGVTLTQISCTTMTACQIMGQNQNVPGTAFYFSPWDGTKWRLDTVGSGNAGGSSLTGFSCYGPTCVVIGWEQQNSAMGETFAWTFHNGVAGAMNLKGLKTMFSADSCASQQTCYAVGFSHGAGVVVTISNGVPSATNEPTPETMGAIECGRKACLAVGGNVILTITHGVVTGTPLTDTATTGFAAITARGTGFAAVGSAAKHGESVLVTG